MPRLHDQLDRVPSLNAGCCLREEVQPLFQYITSVQVGGF